MIHKSNFKLRALSKIFFQMLLFADLKFIQQSNILIFKMERGMKELMVLISACALASSDVFAIKNNDYAGDAEDRNGFCSKQLVDYRNV